MIPLHLGYRFSRPRFPRKLKLTFLCLFNANANSLISRISICHQMNGFWYRNLLYTYMFQQLTSTFQSGYKSCKTEKQRAWPLEKERFCISQWLAGYPVSKAQALLSWVGFIILPWKDLSFEQDNVKNKIERPGKSLF